MFLAYNFPLLKSYQAVPTPHKQNELCQEHITTSLQLPYIPASGFSQTDLFLV